MRDLILRCANFLLLHVTKVRQLAPTLVLFPATLAPLPVVAQTPFVSLDAATASYQEGQGSVTVTITARNADGTAHTTNQLYGVMLNFIDGSGQGGALGIDDNATPPDDGSRDFSRAGSTVFVSFPTQVSTRTRTFQIIDDDVNEGNETFRITLSRPPSGHAWHDHSFNFTSGGGRHLQQTVTIVDNDPPGVTLSPTSVSENAGTVTFTATMDGTALSAPSPSQISFFAGNLPTTEHPARSGQDYVVTQGGPFTLNASNSYSAQFTIQITNDSTDEHDETFGIQMDSPNNSVEEPLFTVTITDDDAPPTVSLNAVSTSFAEDGGTATVTAALSAASGKEITVGYRTENGSASAGEDYESTSGTLTFAPGETEKDIVVQISNDGQNEVPETFEVVLLNDANLANATLGAAVRRTLSIANDDPPGVTLTPKVVNEGQGTVVFTLELDGEPINGSAPTFLWYPEDGTAEELDDFVALQTPATGLPLVSDDGSPTTFRVEIIDDEEIEGPETFIIVVQSPPTGQGAGSIQTLRENVTIRDNDGGSDPILPEISNHLISQSEALLASQPRLADYARNSGFGASDLSLRASSAGLEALNGGIAVGGVWGEATLSRSRSLGANGHHLATSLGSHRQVSNHIFLGGMLQFDRTVTKLDGDGRSGEFAGEGWMVGPYFVARNRSNALIFEGRLLYGRASHDADAVVASAGEAPRDGAFESERWIAQARVEGEYPLGDRAIMYPLADLSHARNVGNGFDEINENQALETDLDVAIRTAVSKLQLGTEFKIPLDPARGELIFRPGLKLEFSDRIGVAFGKSGLATSGRVDLGIDYRLEDNVSLGFQGYYSGVGGGAEFESYGAGLRLRMEF